MLRDHGRFKYSAIVDRPNYSWPDGKRLAFYIALNMEHFSYGEGLGISMSPGIPHPNTYNWAWREYGNRVGVWRLLDLFTDLELPISALLNSELYDHSPEIVAAFRERGDEIVGHGRTNSEHQNDFDEAGEAALIQEATETITKHEGKPPAGWLSPGVNPSDVTPDLLQEAGYTYILDWPIGTGVRGGLPVGQGCTQAECHRRASRDPTCSRWPGLHASNRTGDPASRANRLAARLRAFLDLGIGRELRDAAVGPPPVYRGRFAHSTASRHVLHRSRLRLVPVLGRPYEPS